MLPPTATSPTDPKGERGDAEQWKELTAQKVAQSGVDQKERGERHERSHWYCKKYTAPAFSGNCPTLANADNKRHTCSIFQNQRAMDLKGRLILWWLLLKRYAGFRQMSFSAGKLAQCLIQGDSLRKQRRQGRESHNVSITLLGIIKGRRKITSERERKQLCSRFLFKKKVVIITTTITKLFSMNKIQQNKGAHVKSKPLTPWLHVWAYRKTLTVS